MEGCTGGGSQGVARVAREIEAFANAFRRGRVAPRPCHECRKISSLHARMATLLKSSRTQVNRLLDPKNDITLSTCSVRRRSSDGDLPEQLGHAVGVLPAESDVYHHHGAEF